MAENRSATARGGAPLQHMAPERLARFRWKGEGTYRVLSYYFSVRWNFEPAGAFTQRVLAPFAVPPDPGEERMPPTPGMPPSYTLLDLRSPKVSRYALLYGSDALISCPTVSNLLSQFCWHVNSETIRRTGDFVLIHSGAVQAPGGDAVLLPAASGSGKTTMVAALVQAGFGYLSDEGAAIDPIGRQVHPYPKALTFKKLLTDHFPSLRPLSEQRTPVIGQWNVMADELRPGALADGPAEVRYIIAPRYVPGAPTDLRPISPAAGATILLRNMLNVSLYGPRALPLVADLACQSKSFELTYGDLAAAVEAVSTLTSGRSHEVDLQVRTSA